MEFHGTKLINIEQLGLSQIYLNSHKIASVEKWFDPQCMENFQPVQVHDFGNNAYTLTDGHSRTYVAFKSGISVLPAVYDNDQIVTSQIGQMLYKADIDWCKRFKLSHIEQLGNRIISKSAYEELWIERCDRSYSLLTQTSHRNVCRCKALLQSCFYTGPLKTCQYCFLRIKRANCFYIKIIFCCLKKR